ncbi:MAG: hypothetical protein EOO63_14485 [Hymenobacter sp.]|nr:MAG: hypothetical protein EOO63_14485 [Hymenobacter sp.]
MRCVGAKSRLDFPKLKASYYPSAQRANPYGYSAAIASTPGNSQYGGYHCFQLVDTVVREKGARVK